MSVTPRDFRRVLSILRQARQRGQEAEVWAATVIDGACDLLPARVGILGVSRDFEKGKTARGVVTVRRGWASQAHERVWLKYADTPVMRTPEYKALVTFQGRQITRLRDQIWGREAWSRSRTFLEVHEPAGLDDSVISICRQKGGAHSVSIWMHRAPGDAPFDRRAWWLMHVLTREVTSMLERELTLPRREMEGLTRRQRDTLDRLLAGESEKEAAAALGIKRSTVHEHVLALYRHFGVSSRGELLALFVGRPLPAMERDSTTPQHDQDPTI